MNMKLQKKNIIKKSMSCAKWHKHIVAKSKIDNNSDFMCFGNIMSFVMCQLFDSDIM